MATAIAQLEEEEMESIPDDERPKVCLANSLRVSN